jgi:SAM-dependent methyltransferase
MVNDKLISDLVEKEDATVRFQKNVISKFIKKNGLLIDIGCGSGKFLYSLGNCFDQKIGVEVTPECIDFAKKELGLNVSDSLPNYYQTPDAVTFWHSLEHIPAASLRRIFGSLETRAGKDTTLIISVPNRDSFQYRLLGNLYAYYDYPAHVHQFSYKSLNKLLMKYGFSVSSDIFSFSYITFGYIQGLINCFNPVHNDLYKRMKRGKKPESISNNLLLDIINFASLPVGVFIAIIFLPIEYIFRRKRSVITLCFKKN